MKFLRNFRNPLGKHGVLITLLSILALVSIPVHVVRQVFMCDNSIVTHISNLFKHPVLPTLITVFGTITGAIIGGCITGYYSNKAVKTTLKEQRQLNEEKEKKETTSFLVSIRTEILTVWKQYDEVIGKIIEKTEEGEDIPIRYTITENYFIVYENNTNLLGSIPFELSKSIVETYTKAKNLKEILMVNNNILNSIQYHTESALESSNLNSEKEYHQNQKHKRLEVLKGNGGILRDRHHQLKQNVSILLKAIEDHIKQP